MYSVIEELISLFPPTRVSVSGQSVDHVVVDCVIHKAPGGFAGLSRLDVTTRTWSKELNIDILMTGKRLYI